MPSSLLRFAIVGCGRIASRHQQHIRALGRLVATCDVDLDRAVRCAGSDGAQAYACIERMLEVAADDIDVVSVCSPNGLHSTHAVAALNAGCHVLCEKPMGLTSDECGRMIRASELARRRLFVVKQNRFNPPVAAVKQAIDDGQLGRIHSVSVNCFWSRGPEYYRNADWKGTYELDGGCLYTQFSHFIDLLFWMIGDVTSVHGFTDNFCHQQTVDFEDSGVVALRFSSGALGTMHFTINSFEKNMEGSLTIFAEKGTVKIGGEYLNELEYQRIDDYVIPRLPAGKPANHYGHYDGSMSNHDEVYRNLVDVLRGDGVIATDGYEGMKTVEIIEKIYEAIRWSPASRSSTPKSSTLAAN